MSKNCNNLRVKTLFYTNRWSDGYNLICFGFGRIELGWLRFSAKRYYHQNTEIISRKDSLNMRINRLLKSLIKKQGRKIKPAFNIRFDYDQMKKK